MKLKQLLTNRLTTYELSLVPSSFDLVGDILIFLEFPKELKKSEKLITKEILKHFKNIKVVTKKSKNYSGKYRTPKITILNGEKRKETIHKENNVLIKLDIEKCYFSTRLSGERKRINLLIKPNETVLVMFSGVGVYPLSISKNTKAKEIYGIEINPIAHKYALENIKLNKSKNVELLKGDVKKGLPKLNKKFDRIIMPLPKDSLNYLNLASKYLNKKGTIHLYTFIEETQINKTKSIFSKYLSSFKILKRVKCGEYSPRVYRVCLDLKKL